MNLDDRDDAGLASRRFTYQCARCRAEANYTNPCDERERLCGPCRDFEITRHERWVSAGCPTQAESMSSVRARRAQTDEPPEPWKRLGG